MITSSMSKTARNPLLIRAFKLNLFAVLLLPFASFAEPLLNGLAVSTELGKERFIAALYTDTLSTSASEVLNTTTRRAMELKIVADRLSARSINNMWIEGIAINNSSAALEKQANNTLKLSNFVRKPLIEGDTLRFNTEMGKGVDVVLNGVKLGNIPSDDFFNMLLRTWIGSVPLSSEFRDNLLAAGDIKSDMVSRYSGIQPKEGRAEAVASWNEQGSETQAAAVVAVAAVATEPAKPKIELNTPKPQVSLGELAAPTAAATAIAASDEGKKVAAEQSTKPKAQAEETSKPQQANASAAETKSAPQNTLAVASKSAAAAAVIADEDEEEEVFDIQSLLDRQRYTLELNNLSKKALRYPRIAEQRGQEGDVRAYVILNRDGSVKSAMLVEEAAYSALNKEVLNMIERVAPYPAVPETVKGDQFEFTLPIGFKLK